jgi:hypothetical protein
MSTFRRSRNVTKIAASLSERERFGCQSKAPELVGELPSLENAVELCRQGQAAEQPDSIHKHRSHQLSRFAVPKQLGKDGVRIKTQVRVALAIELDVRGRSDAILLAACRSA